jgi:hypothetical protein
LPDIYIRNRAGMKDEAQKRFVSLGEYSSLIQTFSFYNSLLQAFV